MRSRMAVGAVAAAVALAGCSSNSSKTSTQAQNAAQPTSATSPAGTAQSGSATATAAPTSAAGTGAGSTAAASATAGATSLPGAPTGSKAAVTSGPKPVSALLVGITTPVTTADMPTAKPEWIAAVQKTDDLGKALSGQSAMSLNLVALVDEAAKTSDTAALLKLCNLCNAQKLQQTLTATDSAGLTGFQELSRILEQTHPAPSHTPQAGWDFPGFTRPEKGAATKLDQQDMKLLDGHGTTYTGIRAQFMDLSAGSHPYDGWTGMGAPGT